MDKDSEDSYIVTAQCGLLTYKENLSAQRSTPMQNARDKQIGGAHYKDMVIQPFDFIHSNGLGWCEGNAVKYICRHASKNGEQDLDKAIHYLELLKELEYGTTKDTT